MMTDDFKMMMSLFAILGCLLPGMIIWLPVLLFLYFLQGAYTESEYDGFNESDFRDDLPLICLVFSFYFVLPAILLRVTMRWRR